MHRRLRHRDRRDPGARPKRADVPERQRVQQVVERRRRRGRAGGGRGDGERDDEQGNEREEPGLDRHARDFTPTQPRPSQCSSPSVSQGTYVMSSTPIARMPSIGSVAHVTSSTGFLKRTDASSRLRPSGGCRKPSSRFATKMMPEMHRVDAEHFRQRKDQRHDDDDRREDVHHRADEQQEDVEARAGTDTSSGCAPASTRSSCVGTCASTR